MKRIAFKERLLIFAGAGLVLPGLASAQSTLYTKVGDGTNDRLGASVGDAGDYDDDTFTDFIAGAPEDFSVFDPAPGYARVYSGDDGQTIQTLIGGADWDGFGQAVDGADDYDGDGWDDVIVGAPSAGDSQRGQATVFSGASGMPIMTWTGDEDLDFLGLSVSRAFDVNDDGYADVLVGIPNHDEASQNVGEARVYSGFDNALLCSFIGEQAGDQLGFSVSELGDTDNDGHAEVLIGSLAGGVKVFSDQDTNPVLEFFGPLNSTFGKTVSAIPDVTGDNKPDILIGATEENVLVPGPGFVRCYNGVTGQMLWSKSGLAVGDRFGISLTGTKDWDGDGTPDAVVGADPTNASLQNYVRVLSGVNGDLLTAYVGDTPQDDFGRSVAGLGDINADGHNNVAVGASTGSPNGTASGYVRVYGGPGFGCTGNITPYCTGAVNSTGLGSTMLTNGSTSVGDNNLVLLAINCPPGQNGIFYYGPGQTMQVFGNGFRCVSGQTFRLLPPTPSDGSGVASRALDVTEAPSDSGPGLIDAGSIWNFQYWYRDPSAGPEFFNLSNALTIEFCP